MFRQAVLRRVMIDAVQLPIGTGSHRALGREPGAANELQVFGRNQELELKLFWGMAQRSRQWRLLEAIALEAVFSRKSLRCSNRLRTTMPLPRS